MMTDDEIIAVVQAHKDGKSIQCRDKMSDRMDWNDLTDTVLWSFYYFDYRVKPDSRKPREWELLVLKSGSIFGVATEWNVNAVRDSEVVRVREVIEE